MNRLYHNTIIIYAIRHVHYPCFSLCLVEGTHREHVQLVEVDAPDVAHVDDKHVNNTQFEDGSWQVTAFDGLCFVGQRLPWQVERIRYINYLHQVVRRLNRCIWYALEYLDKQSSANS